MKTAQPSASSDPSLGVHTEAGEFQLQCEKAVHITKAARSATLANVLAPLLCIPMFQDELPFANLAIWLAYMMVVVSIRTGMVYGLACEVEKIVNPKRHLRIMTLAVGIVGFGWGLGWIVMAPDLQMVNRMIYVYMTTAAMISSMFAYSVNTPTFYAFTLPIMIPSLATVLWSFQIFPWPFMVGLASLYLVVLGIAKNFAQTFESSIRLRFRNDKLYQELATERDQSIAANVAKSKFIAVASHDLRQPMHAVNVYLDSIDLDNLPAKERKSLSKIKSSIITLNAMFDALLNVSKLDSDALQVSHRVFRLEDLVTTIRDLNEAKAHEKGLSLTIDGPDLMVRGDKLLLQQIVNNLVSNAIQYTDSGHVVVCFEAVNDALVVEVSDTGCGIGAAEQQLIFNQFYRADHSRSQHDGLGLGLSIVKRLCNLIGAEVRVESDFGQGARFIVTTPFPTTVSQEDALRTHPAAKPLSSNRTLAGKHIAVIEDNPITVEAYRQALASKGAHVQVLTELEAELENQLALIDCIDCILSDYRLSQTTGDVLIQKLRDNYNEDIPAIIVTADTSPSHINLFASLNIEVLHKPVSFHDVVAAIERLLAGP